MVPGPSLLACARCRPYASSVSSLLLEVQRQHHSIAYFILGAEESIPQVEGCRCPYSHRAAANDRRKPRLRPGPAGVRAVEKNLPAEEYYVEVASVLALQPPLPSGPGLCGFPGTLALSATR